MQKLKPTRESKHLSRVTEWDSGQNYRIKSGWRSKAIAFLAGGVLEHVYRLTGMREKRRKVKDRQGIHRARFPRQQESMGFGAWEHLFWNDRKDLGRFIKRIPGTGLSLLRSLCISLKRSGGHLLRVTVGYQDSCEPGSHRDSAKWEHIGFVFVGDSTVWFWGWTLQPHCLGWSPDTASN